MSKKQLSALVALLVLVMSLVGTTSVAAQTVTSSGTVQVGGVVPVPAPTIPAIIDQPQNGSRVTSSLLVIRGTCGADLLVRVFNGTELSGSIICAADGTFVMNIILNQGENVLTVLNYDILNQPGPPSSAVVVTLRLEVAASQDGTAELATSEGSVSDSGGSDEQRLFEGTIVEPFSKVLGVTTTVSAKTNRIIGAGFNIAFIIIVLVLFALMTLR